MIIDTLKNLTIKIGSGSTPSGGKDSYKDSGISLIRSMNVYDFKFEKKGLAFIDENQAKKLDGVKVEENDILFNITGDSINRTCIVPKEILPARVNQHVSIIRCKKEISSHYVNYFLINMKPYLMQICGVGGTRNAITKEVLEKLQIKIQSNQFEIAKVLSDLDAKIELNNKINSELEAMAKLIYDYWFVQFDFPYEFKTVKTDKEGRRTEFIEVKPYKSSGGKMVWNEELKREIPEGWEVKELGDVVEKTGTGLNPRDNFKLGYGENYYVTIKSIIQGKVMLDSKCDRITNEALDIINRRSDLKKGDILFTSIQPVGVTYLLRETPKNWNINESVFTIRPKYSKLTSEFLYMFLSGDFIKAYTENVSAGSIHKGIRHTTLKECKFVLPQRNIIDDYTKIAKQIFEKLHIIDLENQKLSELRDWLLPMLMNGQVKVG